MADKRNRSEAVAIGSAAGHARPPPPHHQRVGYVCPFTAYTVARYLERGEEGRDVPSVV